MQTKKEPIYVTAVSNRRPVYQLGTTVYLEALIDEETMTWWRQFSSKEKFTFRHRCFFSGQGAQLFSQLQLAIKERDGEKVKQVLPEMLDLCQSNYEDLSARERWKHSALQMPGDIGGPNKKQVAKVLTKSARGRVLETMCGFNSYFTPSPEISEVIALDYCQEMLERYQLPTRKRILYNLERINGGANNRIFRKQQF